MKTFLKVSAWTGLGIMALGVIISFQTTFSTPTPVSGGVDFGHPIACIIASIGLILMLIGGLTSKPAYLWLASIITGVLYIASFFEMIGSTLHIYLDRERLDIIRLSISIIPGLIAISEGMALKIFENIRERKPRTP